MPKHVRFVVLFLLCWSALLVDSLNFQSPYFRPWERLQVGWAFKPLQSLSMQRIGDLAYKSRLDEFKARNEITFTTDAYGLRNLEATPRSRVVVCGDSYVAGSGLDDTQTITYKLSELLGEPVFNYAGEIGESPRHFLGDPIFQQYPPKVVIWAPGFRYAALPFSLASPESVSETRLNSWPAQLQDRITDFNTMLNRDNSLGIQCKTSFAQATMYLLGLKPKLPTQASLGINRSDQTIITVEGEKKLVLSLNAQLLTATADNQEISKVVANILTFKQAVEKFGGHFVFAPVPEAGSIYPDMYDEFRRARLQSPNIFDRLFFTLDRHGVDRVDLRPAFRKNRFSYLFLRGDSHWNPRGVEVAAKALNHHLKKLGVLSE